jgi:multidrug resistance protein MdtO
MRRLVESIASIRGDLLRGTVPRPIEPSSAPEASRAVPLLPEMEITVALIPEVFGNAQSLSAYAPPPPGDPPTRVFVPDAFSNAEHLKFALKGCLAASLCYIISTAVAWPGISAALLTCLLTALTTIGASRQKQALHVAGAIVGVVMAVGAQVFILPHVDSIGGFTLLFLCVAGVAAWVLTSGPRLSYAGIQVSFAFYVVHLQEFTIQTSLALARDRVVGIFLGLFIMWMVFDQLWGAPAAVAMKRTFISGLRLLAQLAREPVSQDMSVAIERSYALRETISTTFDRVRALADGVLFEFGSSREPDLALRSRLLRLQTQLRLVFLTRIALLKYRLKLPGFELPKAIGSAQQEVDHALGTLLDGMADRIEGKGSEDNETLEDSFERLQEASRRYGSAAGQGPASAQLQTFLLLSRKIDSLTRSLGEEVSRSFVPSSPRSSGGHGIGSAQPDAPG